MNAPTNLNTATIVALPERPDGISRTFELVVLILPGFSHLALHAFLEPFRIANTVSRLAMFRWRIAGLEKGSVEGASGLSVATGLTIDQLNFLSAERKVDHLAIIAGEPVGQQLTPKFNTFLRAAVRHSVPISAVGTAAWLLAQAGLLANTRCTIHWSRLAAFSEVFDQPQIRDSLFVKDGQISTCAGELAAFDLAVDLIAGYAGGYTAHEVCRHATVEGQRSGANRQTGPSGLAFAGVSDKLLHAMRIMEANVEVPLSMRRVAEEAGVSRRQLERLFSTHVGHPPVRYYLRVRIDHAKRLIEGTRMPIIDIAMACGFISPSHFAKCFKSVHGITPQQCRISVPAWVGPGLG
ncbi:GlxA family transcriptional regulator [Mesorhizobium sp. Cs1299R1N1]|uniref:GlxA family transcriptional regulator n=1 Tax=Mesorhizobium sp. Cs1299R1N1 TaxID=3015172 RepID=UPI00301D0147